MTPTRYRPCPMVEMWSTERAEADRLRALDAAGFGAELLAASAGVLGCVELVTRVASYPLHLRAFATWIPPKKDWWTHAVSLNKDATRVYVSLMSVQVGGNGYGSGLVILDTTDIQPSKCRDSLWC